MPERMPVGDDVVHIGSDLFVANGGRVEYGTPEQGPVGVHSEGSRAWALRGFADPASPSIGSLQVDPILPEIEYSSAYPTNGGDDAWKGIRPDMPHVTTGLLPRD